MSAIFTIMLRTMDIYTKMYSKMRLLDQKWFSEEYRMNESESFSYDSNDYDSNNYDDFDTTPLSSDDFNTTPEHSDISYISDSEFETVESDSDEFNDRQYIHMQYLIHLGYLLQKSEIIFAQYDDHEIEAEEIIAK
ncbi:PREDICTED: uncharacterized protein LOC108783476 [Cyphomyrmex costatus]|uniref:uncharacterized protein LOC108783476 n=1 Tax=Cyphomyrmex costatus TaxID=456900 RepID=UPI00085235C8|nr:PREDICTED: uncharacterized protein LOC108783476 [Cyphomyrmex costatus]